MADRGTEMTDKRLEEIASRLRRIYTEAAKDLEAKSAEYTKRFIAADKKKRADLANGKITQQEYRNWLSGQVFIGKQWQSKVNQMARSLIGVEENAVRLVRDGQLDAFADNTNFMEYQVDRGIGFSGNFTLYDTNTVAELVLNEPELLRRRVVDGVKCEAWNQKVIANCILQGIIQGESIPQIAQRMARDTASTDMNAMYRYARTAMTGAQNAGRIEAMNRSLEQGIAVRKVWIATLDERTRDAHADLDGSVVDVNEPFDSDLGPIMYPGDPDAADENVWNCRCSLGFEYADSPSKWVRYDQEYGEDIEDMDYDEWLDWRAGNTEDKNDDLNEIIEPVSEQKREPVEGSDITGTWEPRDGFDYAIDDVINSQGFDGLPTIVPSDEFDKYVHESQFVAMRGIRADDAETLKQYQNELYNGKWYVNCSHGNDMFGKGMYCLANYDGQVTYTIEHGAKNYAGENGIIEQFTLRPDAKFAIYSEQIRIFNGERITESRRKDLMAGMNSDEKLLLDYALGEKINSAKIQKAMENVGIIRFGELNEKVKEAKSAQKEESKAIREKYTDVGAFTAAQGYDAMVCGEMSGDGIITSIFNRTKCIFRGE